MDTRPRRLKTVGVVGLFLGSLLIVASAGLAAASSTTYWTGQGWPNETCTDNPETMRWNFTNKDATSATFYWDSDSLPMTQHGGGDWFVDSPFFDPTDHTGDNSIYVIWDGTGEGNVVLSGCNEGTVSTPSPSPSASPTASGGAQTGEPTPTKPPTSVADQPVSNGNSGGTVLAIILLAAAGLGLLATSRVKLPKVR